MKLCIDLCSGLGGFSQAFKADSEWEVVTVELSKKQKPTICADVTFLPLKANLEPDALLMSPSCERFSVMCPKWPMKGIKKALELVGSCLEAVVYLKPKKWLMENPRGRLRWFLGNPRQTIRYSDYDLKYPTQKMTDLWGDILLPMVRFNREPHIGHVNNGWWRNGHGEMPKASRDRAMIPFGVSQAVKEGVSA